MGTNLGVGGWCRGADRRRARRAAPARPRSHEFVSFEHCLKVMWHEMAHIVHGNRSAAFYQEMDDIARHYELIKSKGQLVGLDGFPIGGGRNADPQRHNPSRGGARRRAQGRRGPGEEAARHGRRAPRRRRRARRAARGRGPRGGAARPGRGTASATRSWRSPRAAARAQVRAGPRLGRTFRAVCPVCGPVCTDKVEHAEVISDSDDDDLAGPWTTPRRARRTKSRRRAGGAAEAGRPPSSAAGAVSSASAAGRRARPSARRRRRPSTSPRRTRTAGAGLRRRGRARAPLSTPAATCARAAPRNAGAQRG